MSLNLLDMLKDQVTGQLANQASSFLGEDESAVTKALGGIFPSVLGSVISSAGDKKSASGLMDMIGGLDTNMLGNIGNLFGGGASSVNGLLNSGGGILNTLLGDKMGGIVQMISKMSGLGSGSAGSLMKMAAPFLMSLIGKQVAGKGVSGLMDLLMGQKEHVAKALPSGMGSLLGLADMGGLGDMAGKAMGAVSGAAGDVANAGKSAVGNAGKLATGAVGGAANLAGDAGKAAGRVAGSAANAAGEAASTGLGWIKWALPFLLIGAAAIWFFTKGGADKVTGAMGDAMEVTKDAAGSVAGAAGDVASAAGEMTKDAAGAVANAAGAVFGKVDAAAKAALDKVTFVAGSAGSQMNEYITGGFKGDSNFTFRNLNFATGSAELGSSAEVDNLAAILKAYPGVNVTVNGYTDNTGDATKNQALSEARAASVMGRLVAQGIDVSRIKAVGNGDANPVADNGTAEGRAQNRRIEISINK